MIGFNTDASIVENIVENSRVNVTQIKILELMRYNPRITIEVIAREIKIAPRNVQVNIRKLKAMDLVERIGPAKGGQWVVNT